MHSNNDLMPENWTPTKGDDFTQFMDEKKAEFYRTHPGVFNTIHVQNWAHEYVRKIQNPSPAVEKMKLALEHYRAIEKDETSFAHQALSAYEKERAR